MKKEKIENCHFIEQKNRAVSDFEKDCNISDESEKEESEKGAILDPKQIENEGGQEDTSAT